MTDEKEKGPPELAPCGHKPPETSATLHGICLFCFHSRLAVVIERRDELRALAYDLACYVRGQGAGEPAPKNRLELLQEAKRLGVL